MSLVRAEQSATLDIDDGKLPLRGVVTIKFACATLEPGSLSVTKDSPRFRTFTFKYQWANASPRFLQQTPSIPKYLG
jgi:hypothetical protein